MIKGQRLIYLTDSMGAATAAAAMPSTMVASFMVAQVYGRCKRITTGRVDRDEKWIWVADEECQSGGQCGLICCSELLAAHGRVNLNVRTSPPAFTYFG